MCLSLSAAPPTESSSHSTASPNWAATQSNSHRTVHLYDYLMAGAKRARENSVAAEILSDDATVVDDLVGPFRLQATHSASLTAVAAAIVDADGREVTGPVEPGTEFYVRPQ